MRNCIRIPRILLPKKDFRHWSVIACDQYTSDREYWQNVEREVGNRPSSLRFILPEIYLGENDEERIAEIRENMHTAMVEGWMEKLDRGFVLTERTTASGIRRGLIVAIDLEAYSCRPGEVTPIRSSEEVVPDRLPARIALRRESTLEFPHAIVFYKDKKDRVMKDLLKEDLEKLEPGERVRIISNLLQYVTPKMQSISPAEMLEAEYRKLEELLESAPDEAIDEIVERVKRLKDGSGRTETED